MSLNLVFTNDTDNPGRKDTNQEYLPVFGFFFFFKKNNLRPEKKVCYLVSCVKLQKLHPHRMMMNGNTMSIKSK